MKITKSLFAIALTAVILVGCKKNENSQTGISQTKTPIAADAKLATVSFTIDGMTCPEGCAKTIEKELNDTNGVKTATVDFDKKTATVVFDTKTQKAEQLLKIVEKTGDGATYKVSNLKSL